MLVDLATATATATAMALLQETTAESMESAYRRRYVSLFPDRH